MLNQQPYHTPTLINLALIDPDTSNGLHNVDIAEQFVINNKLTLAKGMLLSKIGKIKDAHEAFTI